MSNKSNWEDSRAPAAPATAAAAAVHDGFQESDVHPAESVLDVVDTSVRKKGGSLAPKLLLGLMGLSVVGVLGFFGTRLMSVGSHKAATAQVVRTPMPVTAVTEPSHATGQGTVIMGGEAVAANSTAAAVNATALAAAPVVPVAIAGLTSPAPAAPAIVVAAAASQVVPVVAPPDERLNEANARVRGLEQEVQQLRGQLAAKPTPVLRFAGTDTPAAAKHHVRPRARVAAAGVQSKEPAMITEVAAPLTSPEISRLQLRGVYPRSGDDMQAWIMDGDKTRTVSKGDVINGARVLRVETDRVVTSLGSIH